MECDEDISVAWLDVKYGDKNNPYALNGVPYFQELINEHNGWTVWPIIRFSYDTINYDLEQPAPSAPTLTNWLGTDDQGRDVTARLIYGFRLSVLFATILTLASSVIGVAAGALQGYYGGKLDLIFQRFIEIWSGLPVLFLLIILASLVEPNFWWLLVIMLLFSSPKPQNPVVCVEYLN